MKNISILIVPLTIIFFFSKPMFSEDRQYGFTAYKVYDKDGKEQDFAKVLDKAMDADIVFFGELHNNVIAHWLELELAKGMFFKKKEGKSLVIGAEMFESDDQLVLDEYLQGKIPEKNFEQEAKLWNNYKTDYKPLLTFAFENKLPYIATNAPRRYAALVNNSGFDGLNDLSDVAKSFIAPLPIDVDLELPCYKKMEEMMGGHSPMVKKTIDTSNLKTVSPTQVGEAGEKIAFKDSIGSLKEMATKQAMPKMPVQLEPGKMNNKMQNFKQAQAIKDATMAHFIIKNLPSNGIFLHLNGAYHSDNYEGIVWFIKKAKPQKKILTITTIEKDNIDDISDEDMKKADYIIVVPSSMNGSY